MAVNTEKKKERNMENTPQYAELTEGLGQRVMLKRLDKGLGLREAAAAAGVDPATWRGIEGGRVPRAATLKRVADLYGISPLELLSIPSDAA